MQKISRRFYFKFRQRCFEKKFFTFEGICLTDTFEMFERDESENYIPLAPDKKFSFNTTNIAKNKKLQFDDEKIFFSAIFKIFLS